LALKFRREVELISTTKLPSLKARAKMVPENEPIVGLFIDQKYGIGPTFVIFLSYAEGYPIGPTRYQTCTRCILLF